MMLSLSLSLLPFRLRGALDGSQLERPPCSLVPLLERNADFAGVSVCSCAAAGFVGMPRQVRPPEKLEPALHRF